MVRKFTMLHDPYVVRWMAENFPFGTWRINVRLGAIRPELEARLPEKYKAIGKIVRLIADAIAIWNGKVTIVEAVIRPGEYYKIQQLNTYERAFRVTEEYREYWNYPIEKIILTPETDPFMESEAARYGIRVVRFITPAVEEYLHGLPKRYGKPRGGGLTPL